MRSVFLFLVIFALLSKNAFAYVGPGLGLGVIGAFVGLVVAVFLAIIGVIWYPLKRLLRKLKGTKVDMKDNMEDMNGSE